MHEACYGRPAQFGALRAEEPISCRTAASRAPRSRTARRFPPAACGSTCSIPRSKNAGAVNRALGIEMPTRADMEEIEISSRLYQEDGGLFMTALVLSQTDTDHADGRCGHLRADARTSSSPSATSIRSRSAPSPRAASAPVCMPRRAEMVLMQPARRDRRPHGRHPGDDRRGVEVISRGHLLAGRRQGAARRGFPEHPAHGSAASTI